MKNDGASANIARNDHRAMSGASEHSVTELATSLAMMHATLESTTDAILVTDETNRVREFNQKYIKLWGIPPHMMVPGQATELWDYISPQLKDPARYLARVQEIVTSSAMESFDVLELKDGRVFERNSTIQMVDQQSVGRVWSFRDITRRKRAEDAQCLREGAAPGLPEGYNRIVDGLRIGPRVGSCGSAAYKREPVFATDIASDPHWADYVELAANFGLGSCCSTPVFSSDGILLGTVAMYYHRPHEPSAHDRELIRMATHLAGIVIERARAVEQLRVAKVAAEQRAQEITTAYHTLRTTQETLNAELASAVDYVFSLLPRPITEERVSADWSMTTSAQLGGDGLGYHWMDSQRFAFYLLDVSGHGVKSALLAVSIIDTLRTCGLADTDWNDPGAVLRALNRVYFSQSREHLYFTIWYGIADLANGTLRYAGGGHPPAIVRAAQHGNPKLPASGPPVGCFANAKYPTVEMPLYFPAELYLFSDGVFETRRHQDEVPLDRLVDFLVAPRNRQGRTVADIRNRTLEHLHGTPPPDDCSVLKVLLTDRHP